MHTSHDLKRALARWDEAVRALEVAKDGEAESARRSMAADDAWYAAADPLLPSNRLARAPFGVGMGG